MNGDGDTFEKYTQEIIKEGKTPQDVEPTEQPVVSAMLDLRSRSQRDSVSHIDIWSGNVGWGSDGKLKFIDLEAVEIGGQFASEKEQPEQPANPLEVDLTPEEIAEIPAGGLFG